MRDYYRTYVNKSPDFMTGTVRRVTRGNVTPGHLAAAIAWAKEVSALRVKIINHEQTIAVSSYGLQSVTSQTEFGSWEQYDAEMAKIDASPEHAALWAKRADHFLPGTMLRLLYKRVD